MEPIVTTTPTTAAHPTGLPPGKLPVAAPPGAPAGEGAGGRASCIRQRGQAVVFPMTLVEQRGQTMRSESPNTREVQPGESISRVSRAARRRSRTRGKTKRPTTGARWLGVRQQRMDRYTVISRLRSEASVASPSNRTTASRRPARGRRSSSVADRRALAARSTAARTPPVAIAASFAGRADRPARRDTHERLTASAIRRLASAERRRPLAAFCLATPVLPTLVLALASWARRSAQDLLTPSAIFFFASSDNFDIQTSDHFLLILKHCATPPIRHVEEGGIIAWATRTINPRTEPFLNLFDE